MPPVLIDHVDEETVVEFRHVDKFFVTRRGGTVHAIRDISFRIRRGECLALIGESGAGKSTVGRLLLGLETPDAGSVRVGARDLSLASKEGLRSLRRAVTLVFQEPFESLNPRRSIARTVEMPLKVHEPWLSRAERTARVEQALALVRLPTKLAGRYPSELSGGQQQRVGLARALVTSPAVVILDEPTSSLDAEVRTEMWRLLKRLQAELGLTYLLITHDMSTVAALADRVAVLYRGSLMERGSKREVLEAAGHPYTRLLLASVLSITAADLKPRPVLASPDGSDQQARDTVSEIVADPQNGAELNGCSFRPRCDLATDACASGKIQIRVIAPGHHVACIHFAADHLEEED
jgi:oligopeptide/dipeptide ABC transporter ATP-binding protein